MWAALPCYEHVFERGLAMEGDVEVAVIEARLAAAVALAAREMHGVRPVYALKLMMLARELSECADARRAPHLRDALRRAHRRHLRAV